MGLFVFLKAQAASILGSLADYMMTIILTEFLGVSYILSSTTGNLVGGSLQFILCRNWAFIGGNGQVRSQIVKFILVFAGNLILSALGLYLLTHYFKLNYLVAKTIVSILLGSTYSYFLQKKFVFV